MGKELFMAEHERLVADYMDEHDCDWTTAYEATSDKAYDSMRDRLADKADELRQRAKDAWPLCPTCGKMAFQCECGDER